MVVAAFQLIVTPALLVRSAHLTPMTLGHTLFKFERPVLVQNSRNKGRVYFVHRYRHRGPIPASLVVPSIGDVVPSAGPGVSVAADPSLNDSRGYSSRLKVLDGSLGR